MLPIEVTRVGLLATFDSPIYDLAANWTDDCIVCTRLALCQMFAWGDHDLNLILVTIHAQ